MTTAELKEIKQIVVEVENAFEKWGNLVPEVDKARILKQLNELQHRRLSREEQIKKCHPDGGHWPPHEDCPACQKLMEKIENEAKVLLGDEAHNEKKLNEKVWELFQDKYLKGPNDK